MAEGIMSGPFDFGDQTTVGARRQPAARFVIDFVSRFFATFFAVLLAGALLLVGVRYYIRWEIERGVEAIERGLKDLGKPLPNKK
jgi:hypothetical protein